MKIPFLDLVAPHRELEQELVRVFRKALSTAGFIGGSMVEGFEEEFAAYCSARYCVGVGSGTDALRFALMATGIKQGDIVITVPNTFIATTEAISQVGAVAEFIDINEKTYNIDVTKLQEYIESKCYVDEDSGRLVNKMTRQPVTAVVPVHLYGQIADMDRIMALAKQYGLIVIEDSCQAHGAQYFSIADNCWRTAGSIGHAAAFSFYPGKNLGACGEAGAITTNDEDMAKMMKMIRDHGQAKKYYHDIEGYNGRLDAIQAGFLSVKLKHLPAWTEARRAAARRYNDLLNGIDGVIAPFEDERSKAVYHLYVIRTKNRDEMQNYLSSKGIFTGLHYPVPLHLQNAYSGNGFRKGDFPAAEKAASEILSLPMFPGLTEEQRITVAETIREWTKQNT